MSLPESAPLPGGTSDWVRLRELISALHLHPMAGNDLAARLDPAIADELHAMVAHRGLKMADFMAEALMEVAFDAADAAWHNALRHRAGLHKDPEAELLSHVFEKAMRLHLQSETMLAAGQAGAGVAPFAARRVGHSYTPE